MERKKTYASPEISCMIFTQEDVITSSSIPDSGSGIELPDDIWTGI